MSTAVPSTGRSNDVLWAALGFLGVVVLSYLYVGPRMSELKDARAVTRAREKDNQDIQTQMTNVAQITQQLNSQPEALGQLALAAPVGAAPDQLLVALQSIASESGVVLLSVQPNVANAVQSQTSSVVTLRGSYTGVHLFFELLQKNIRPLSATNVAIASAVDTEGASLLNVSLTVLPAQVVSATPTTTLNQVQP